MWGLKFEDNVWCIFEEEQKIFSHPQVTRHQLQPIVDFHNGCIVEINAARPQH